MRWYYFLLIAAGLLDSAVLPWLFGASWLPKLVLAILPFGFLFSNSRDLKIIFVLALIYLRAASEFNLGLLFLALVLFLFFERWFLTNFFHRSAWQTLALSGWGVAVFYVVLFGLSSLLNPAAFVFGAGRLWPILTSALAAAGASFLINKLAQVKNV